MLFTVPISVERSQPILVVGYHEFGGKAEYAGGPRYDIHGLNISPSVFRNQLRLMYEKGFLPLNARDLTKAPIRIPKGKHPVVLTFDDGRATQFRYLPSGKIDPDCAVAILLDFHRVHKDWPLKGSFYIIAGSDINGVPFDQEGLEKRKILQLLNWGFEIGNHTLTHPSFKDLNLTRIKNEIGGGASYLKGLIPSIKVDTFALPYGQVPSKLKNCSFLGKGKSSYGDYLNLAILLFDDKVGIPTYSPRFRSMIVDRIAPIPGVVERLLGSKP